MKASKLISILAELMGDHGDIDVKIEILTENASNTYIISDVDASVNWVGDKWEYSSIIITHDVDNVKEFKKNLK